MAGPIRSLFGRFGSEPSARVGLFVDGPNTFRDEFDVDFNDIREAGEATGQLAVTRLYLDEHATPGLIMAAEANGFEVLVTSGDVDVKLAIDATELVVEEAIDTLVVVSRDTDFKPVLEKAAERGIKTIAIAPGEHGRSDALRKTAQEAYLLDELKRGRSS